MVATRSVPKATDQELAHGVPVFLDQLIKTLIIEQTAKPRRSSQRLVDPGEDAADVGDMAAQHGRDLLGQGFTLEQVVRDYGDVCQAVTNLAFETGAPIEVDEFRTFNRCLDNAIAGAVTEYARHSTASGANGNQAFNSRLAPLAHELRNHLSTATLAVRVIKAGSVGISGATGAVLDRSILGMRNLIDRSLAEVRFTAGIPPHFEHIHLATFFGQIGASASLDAQARECQLLVLPVDDDITVYADLEMLTSAVGNLLQNAFKFTKRHTDVRLHAQTVAGRVLIDVEDHCGGLPDGAAENLFLPFRQRGHDRSGLGLGLDICRRNVEANNGFLRVRDVAGVGCIFTIELPRHT